VSPLGTSATNGLLYQPRLIDDAGCGAVYGMRIGRGNRSTRRKPAPMSVFIIIMALHPFVGPWPLFSFLILYAVGRTPSTGDQPVARPLPTQRTTETEKTLTIQTSMP
jgi:hypothetical protein